MTFSAEEAKAGSAAVRPGARDRVDLLAQVALGAGVLAYWAVLAAGTIRLVPLYAGELQAIAEADWLSMWTWVDYGKCFRYSPTALLPLGLIDRHVVAPLLGIPFPSPEFVAAPRLIPVFLVVFALIAVITYRLCRFLELGVAASLVAGLFIGLHKGFAYYLGFVSTIAPALLILYAMAVLFCGVRYLRTERRGALVGYYVSLLLAVGAWEQWINLLVFLIVGSLLAARQLPPGPRRRLWLHGVLVPGLVGATYLLLHTGMVARESRAVTEAQFVLSYPSVALMAEDMVVNASHHVASIVEPILFPWPMLSRAVLGGYNMDQHNRYNQTYTPHSAAHYRVLGDWYAGLLFGVWLCATALLVRHLRRGARRMLPGAMGLLLTWSGFTAHLPVMYRTYFVLPGYASLLDYKHALSILGFALLLGWSVESALQHLPGRRVQGAAVAAVALWLVYCNYGKIAGSLQFSRGVYPW
jgi:hypothetical protein